MQHRTLPTNAGLTMVHELCAVEFSDRLCVQATAEQQKDAASSKHGSVVAEPDYLLQFEAGCRELATYITKFPLHTLQTLQVKLLQKPELYGNIDNFPSSILQKPGVFPTSIANALRKNALSIEAKADVPRVLLAHGNTYLFTLLGLSIEVCCLLGGPYT